MVTGELKSRIDSLWEIFWTGGLTNPLDVIEQMTYLMFIHDLDDADNLRARESAMLGLPYQGAGGGDRQGPGRIGGDAEMSIQINNNVLSKGWKRFTIMHKDRKVAAIREDGTCTIYDTHIYSKYNVDATMSAAKELSDRAFKLYARLNLHQDGHVYALSPIAIQADIGMSDKRYREAVKELTDKGYLVQQEKHKSLYVFYEFPQRDDKHYRQEPKSPDNPPESAGASSQNGRMARPNRVDNPAILGGEIEHNITSHTTNNTTINSNNRGYSPKEERRFYIDDILGECSLFLANPKKEDFSSGRPIYDDDDAIMYADPEKYVEGNDFGGTELPF